MTALLTGPPYPPAPVAGSNGIGEFIIGVSAIGSIPPFNFWDTIISQYANSPVITSLIENAFFDTLDLTADLDVFYSNIWDVSTAVGRGLDIWGRIVGVSRILEVNIGNWFGFASGVPGADTFGQGAFYSGAPLTSNYALSDESYRTLIYAKAMANITDGSIPAINQILLSLFPHRGNCYVTDGATVAGQWFGFAQAAGALTFNQGIFYSGSPVIPRMQMTYTFEFQLSPVELAIVQNSGVLPKSTGVAASVVINV